MEWLILGGKNYECLPRGSFYVPKRPMWVCLQLQPLSELCEVFHFPVFGNGHFAEKASDRTI
jgi:hypothetical protein